MHPFIFIEQMHPSDIPALYQVTILIKWHSLWFWQVMMMRLAFLRYHFPSSLTLMLFIVLFFMFCYFLELLSIINNVIPTAGMGLKVRLLPLRSCKCLNKAPSRIAINLCRKLKMSKYGIIS